MNKLTKRQEYMKNWRANNKNYCRLHWKKWYNNVKRRALLKVGHGNIKCINCGDKKYDWMEINHKNGGGRREHAKYGGVEWYRAIANNKRSIEDLELRCKPCNIIHYAELLTGFKYIRAL